MIQILNQHKKVQPFAYIKQNDGFYIIAREVNALHGFAPKYKSCTRINGVALKLK